MKRNLLTILPVVAMAVWQPAEAVDVSVADRREQDVNADIVTRCYYEMGEFGNAGLNVCIEAEKKARASLSDYPDDTADIVRRCIVARYRGGWQRIRSCVDADIQAQDALGLYAPEHAVTIDECRRAVESGGPAMVKACVDERIAGEGGDTN